MAQRILVTGGAGFIGSFLVRELVSQGFEVRILDNLSTGSLSNLREVLDFVEFIEGDIRNEKIVEKSIKGVEAIVHLAALINVAESIEKPDLYFDVNVRGTFNLAKASRSVSAFIFASSCAVYGDPVRMPITEDHPLMMFNIVSASAYNIGSGISITINELARLILRIMNREDLKPVHTTPSLETLDIHIQV